ncbi:MAG TPA: hypothetical protein VEU47_11035 [Candidatus Cybelea sp.]|nr:hypothetical protein [Candidatus Cybelea sp.]
MSTRVIASSYLTDSPLLPQDSRESRVLRMAEALIEHEAYADRADAVRCLRSLGFSIFDIHVAVDDARQVAAQVAVAEEIAGS